MVLRINKCGKDKFSWFLVIFFVMFSLINGDIPVEVKIDFNKNEVLPGEEMVITLNGFKNMLKRPAHKGFWINVEVLYGKILNGFDMTGSELDVVSPDGKPLPKSKTFRIGGENGDGIVRVHYKASLYCPENEENISVISLMHISDEIPSKDIQIVKVIGKKVIPYRCPDYLIMTGYQYVHSDDGYQSSSMEFEVKLRVIIKPVEGINVFRIHSADVIGFNGQNTYKSSDEDRECHLSSAECEEPLESVPDDFRKKYLSADKSKPGSYDKMVSGMLWPGSESETYRGITITPFLVKLTWTGDEPYGPEKIVVGPVTRMKKPAMDPSLQKLRKDMKGKDRKDMAKAMSSMDLKNLMGTLEGMVVHPDHRATTGNMRTRFGGGGTVTQTFEHGHSVKKYIWEIFLNVK